VRGIFKHEYGVDLNKVTWVCNDDGHLAEFKDPPHVERTPPDAKKVDQMLLDGEIDGAILGVENLDDPGVAPLIPNPKQAAMEWYRKYNTVPVNHLFCVDKDLADSAPGRGRRNLPHAESQQGRDAALTRRDRLPSVGVEALRKPLAMIRSIRSSRRSSRAR
jgi:4,5-dihydroxyphthalate decarboxylase